MKTFQKTIALFICALLFCALLTGCAAGEKKAAMAPAEVTAEPEKTISVYTADFRDLAGDSAHYLGARSTDEEGFYSVDYAVEDSGEYRTSISYVSYDGGVKPLKDYRPVSPPAELTSMPDFYCTHELEGIASDAEGDLIVVESLYMSWYAGPGERRDEYATAYDDYSRLMYVRRLDPDGRELSCELMELDGDENIYSHDLKIDARGNLVVSEQSRLRFFSVTGEELGQLELGGYVRTVLQNKAGDIAAVSYDEDGGELLSYINVDSFSVTGSAPIPGGGMYLCLGDEEHDLYYSNGESLCGYALDTGVSTELFNWLSLGININSVSHLERTEKGFRAISSHSDVESGGFRTELAEIYLEEIPESQVKKTLTLGCMEADNDLENTIVAFNRSNEDFCIEVTEYFLRYDFGTEGQRGRLMRELMSGNLPDILVLEGINHRMLASRGLLADLGPFLESSDKLKREDFFPNLLQCGTLDGKLYAMAHSFTIDTVLANAALVGYEPGWSYQDYYMAYGLMPADCTPFEVYTTSEELLSAGLAMELNSWINWTELTADFENDGFYSLLAFADTFPDSFDWDNYAWSDADIIEYRIAGGRQMLLRTSLMSIEEIYYNSIYFNGQPSYIGYPSHDGSVGNLLVPDRLCAISESSPYKAEAWQFMESLLGSGDIQWGFPANRRLYEQKLEAMMTPSYLTDSEDQPVLTEEGEQIELAQGHMGTVLGVRGFYALTEQQAAQLTRVLESCEKLKCEEPELISLVIENCKPYFEAGQSAEGTAAQVERAVESYLAQYK